MGTVIYSVSGSGSRKMVATCSSQYDSEGTLTEVSSTDTVKRFSVRRDSGTVVVCDGKETSSEAEILDLPATSAYACVFFVC